MHKNTFLRNLATALILYEKIDTTEAKAKEVKPYIEHLFATAYKNTLQSRRELLKSLLHRNAIKKVFEIMVPNLQRLKKFSGHVQMYRLGARAGDGAEKIRMIIDPQITEPPTLTQTKKISISKTIKTKKAISDDKT